MQTNFLPTAVSDRASRVTVFIFVLSVVLNCLHAGTASAQEDTKRDPYSNFGEVGHVFILSLGGKVYDDIWVMTETEEPETRNPAFPKDLETNLGTWRCVSCHGWDYRGEIGERGEQKRGQIFADLAHLRDGNVDDVIAKIKAAPHDYPEGVLDDFVVELLALFITSGQYSAEIVLDRNGNAVGDIENGRVIFEGACMNCHDIDGRGYLKGERGDRSSLGWVARNRPEQALHKIQNGVPGTLMLAMRFLSPQSTADLLAYLQSLDPDER